MSGTDTANRIGSTPWSSKKEPIVVESATMEEYEDDDIVVCKKLYEWIGS